MNDMKTLIALTALVACTAGAQAQTTNNSPDAYMSGWGPNSTYNRNYSKGRETNVAGKIVSIDTTRKPQATMSPVTDLKIRGTKGTVDVHLGPSWYLRNLSAHLQVGNTVKVTGSLVALNGSNVILARKLSKGNRVLYLRDVSGFPMWIATNPVYAQNTPGATTSGATAYTNNPNVGDSPFGPVAFSLQTPSPAVQNFVNNSQAPTQNAGAPQIQPNTPSQSVTPGGAAINSSKAPSTVTAPAPQIVQGTVQNLVNYTNPQTGESESYLVMTTPTGNLNVDLGPTWFIQQQGMKYPTGASILVNGVLVPGNVVQFGVSGPVISANGVNINNQIMVLRNGNVPVWNPWFGTGQ